MEGERRDLSFVFIVRRIGYGVYDDGGDLWNGVIYQPFMMMQWRMCMVVMLSMVDNSTYVFRIPFSCFLFFNYNVLFYTVCC